jgi:hypothetical protein
MPGFTRRVQWSSESMGSQFRATLRRVFFFGLVLIGLARWITGEWLLWLAIIPAMVGLWWLWRVARDAWAHIRGYGGMPPLARGDW